MKQIRTLVYTLPVFAVVVMMMAQSCVKEELDFDKLSSQVEYKPGIYTPLVKGSFTIRDLFREDSEDTVVHFNGDSIYLLLNLDSILALNVADFVNIPDQGTQVYQLESGPTDIIYPLDDIYINEQIENLDLSFESTMQVDSIFTNSGYVRLEIASNYSSDGYFEITSPNLLLNDQPIDTIFTLSRVSGDYHMIHDIPLRNAKIIFDNSNPDTSKFNFTLRVVVVVNGPDTIKANSFANVSMSINDINDFEVIFGYAGDSTFSSDTILETNLGDIQGLSGMFAITNPRIYLDYDHTFGFPMGIDLNIKGIFEDNDSVVLLPGLQMIPNAADYRNPETSGRLTFGRNNLSNIDQFLVFPPPVQIGTRAAIMANPDGDTGIPNFILGNSYINVNLDVEIPLEFRADLEFRDTVKIDLKDVEITETQYIEYARLYYWFRNEFPLNIDGYIILYDSIADVTYDTIQFNDLSNRLFIEAAPVDANGITIMDQVTESRGLIDLNRNEIDNLINVANNMIVIGKLSSYNVGTVSSVKLLDYYSFNFRFNLDTKAYYRGSLND